MFCTKKVVFSPLHLPKLPFMTKLGILSLGKKNPSCFSFALCSAALSSLTFISTVRIQLCDSSNARLPPERLAGNISLYSGAPGQKVWKWEIFPLPVSVIFLSLVLPPSFVLETNAKQNNPGAPTPARRMECGQDWAKKRVALSSVASAAPSVFILKSLLML